MSEHRKESCKNLQTLKKVPKWTDTILNRLHDSKDILAYATSRECENENQIMLEWVKNIYYGRWSQVTAATVKHHSML